MRGLWDHYAVCQTVSMFPTNNFWNSLVDFYEIEQAGDAFETYIDVIIFSLLNFLKEKCRLIRLRSCLCVCHPYQLLNQLEHFYDIR
jgi:hypothetical protein